MTSASRTGPSPGAGDRGAFTGRATGSRPDVLTGTLAGLGGAAWVAAALMHAAQPEGCVGDSCTGIAMREATTATTVLVGLAAVLMLASGAGLLLAVRRAGSLGRPGVVGATLCATGAVTLAVAVTLQELVVEGEFEWMPWFVGPGVILLAVGAVLIGWTVLRSPVVPRWTGWLLVVGAVLLVASNEQTSRVLLVVPFGLAWATTGVALALGTDTGGKSRNDVR